MSSNFDAWALLADLGLISLLLLIGKLMRVKIALLQRLFIPPSMIAGLLGLILGGEGFAILPFSGMLGTYSSILIALVFGALPLSWQKVEFAGFGRRVGPVWAYAQLGMFIQWSLAALFGLVVLKFIWPSLNSAFGVMLSTGFYGGHGTAAAIGGAFDSLGWSDATSLGMTTATTGVVVAVVMGLFILKRATVSGQTNYVKDFNDLPPELRSGLLSSDKREVAAEATTSSISMDSLGFHLALVFLVAFVGYLMNRGVKVWFPMLEMPVFSCAFIAGIVLKLFLDKSGASSYVCSKQIGGIGGTFTDLLVAFGVASIKLSVVLKYALPLIILIVFGIILVWFTSFYLGKRIFRTNWFERSLFAWGWWTGTMAMGIALLRISDPKNESGVMEDYAMAYLPIAPVEILLITFVPPLFCSGYGFWFVFGLMVASVAILFFSYKKGWLKRG